MPRGASTYVSGMKLLRSLGLVWVLSLALAAAEKMDRVLFIGNSYTGVNQLPKVFGEVLKSAQGSAPVIKSSTPGGQTLLQQLSQKGSLALIDEGNWDVVVLQGQSQEPAFAEIDPKIRQDFLESAQKLAERVRSKSPKAKIFFYETWARHADYWKKDEKAMNLGANPTEMQTRLRHWYVEAASLVKAEAVVPVGDAWELNYQKTEPHRLHAPDNSHPNFAGTYLAALVFYKTICHPADLKIAYREKLSEDEARYLQGLAQDVKPLALLANKASGTK